MERTFQPLYDSELTWVTNHVDVARVVVAYAGATVDDLPTQAQLDAAWSVWLNGDGATVDDPNTMDQRLRTGIRRDHGRFPGNGLVVITDEYGTETGVLTSADLELKSVGPLMVNAIAGEAHAAHVLGVRDPLAPAVPDVLAVWHEVRCGSVVKSDSPIQSTAHQRSRRTSLQRS